MYIYRQEGEASYFQSKIKAHGIEFVEGLKPGTGISEGEITLPAKHEFLIFGNAGLNRNSTL